MAAVHLSRSTLLPALGLAALAGLCLTTRAGGLWLAGQVERTVRPGVVTAARPAQAIVVLTGGEPRNREAARLQRATGLPLLASGGDGEAALMKRLLERDFGVPVRWTEDRSLSTEENARFSARLLAAQGIRRIVLVTHALHMPRAQRMFADQQLEVTPAPVDFWSRAPRAPRDYLPGTEGLKLTRSALHEIAGHTWYRATRALR